MEKLNNEVPKVSYDAIRCIVVCPHCGREQYYFGPTPIRFICGPTSGCGEVMQIVGAMAITGQQLTGGQPDPHPEDTCQSCGFPNATWSAPNELWNEINGSREGVICPACFEELASRKGYSVMFRAIISGTVRNKRCVLNDEGRKRFPKPERSGTITLKSKRYYYIKWDGLKSSQPYPKEYITIVQPAKNEQP